MTAKVGTVIKEGNSTYIHHTGRYWTEHKFTSESAARRYADKVNAKFYGAKELKALVAELTKPIKI